MYYFIGIKGSGMSSLALLLNDLGHEVKGSDKKEHFFTEDKLIEKGIEILPFDKDNIKEGYNIICGNAFGDENEEVTEAKKLGLKIYTYQEILSLLSQEYKTITVSGCHGKTTTSTIMHKVFNDVTGSNALIGDGTGYAEEKNEFFILEACEWKRHFLNYKPYYAIITNIDLDHLDYFKDLSDVKNAFEEYANKAEKYVIACGDDENVRDIEISKPIVYYGFKEANDVVAKNIKNENGFISFDVFIRNEYYGNINIPLYGKHMILNTLAVISCAYLEGLDKQKVIESLSKVKGAKRRFVENTFEDIVTVGDYAHHPREVEVTIKAAKEKYPNKKIIAVLLVHTLSRAKEFSKEFAQALNLADHSFIMDIYTDRVEVGYDDVNHNLILESLESGEHITNDISGAIRLLEYKDSVILFMSSKEIYVLQEAYEKMILNRKLTN